MLVDLVWVWLAGFMEHVELPASHKYVATDLKQVWKTYSTVHIWSLQCKKIFKLVYIFQSYCNKVEHFMAHDVFNKYSKILDRIFVMVWDLC